MELRDTTKQEKTVLEWLNDVRESGRMNFDTVEKDMETKFKVSKSESERLLALWERNFNDSGVYDDVIKE